MTALFTLPGVGGTDKVPMHASQNLQGRGSSSGQKPWYVVCTGNKVAAGSVTADSYVGQAFSEDEINSRVGARSECAQQAREALELGAAVVLAPVKEATGAVAATLVLNCESAGTGSGTVTLHVGDETVSWAYASTETRLAIMTRAMDAINAKSTLFCVATLGAAAEYDVTLTVSSAGIRGNDWVAQLDLTEAPSGADWNLGRDTDVDAIKLSIATVAGAASYNGAALNGTPGGAAFTPPRRAMVTSSVAALAYSPGTTVTFTGTLAGAPQTDVVTITDTNGGETLIGDAYFDQITQIDIQAQLLITGAFEFGLYSEAEPTATGWVRFAGGTGTDDCSTVIGLLEAAEYRRIAAAQNDATNAARWEAHADSESGPLVAHLEQVVFGANGTSAAAISLAQTTLNAYLCQVAARRNSRKHPCQIAARVAATRAVFESQNPWERFDGKWNDEGSKLWSDVPALVGDEWTHAELVSLLDAGVTPLLDFNGTTCIVRSICSHSLNGTDADWRCLDTAEVTVPQYVRDGVNALATTEAENNPGVGPDLPDGQPSISGVSTPRIWNATVQSYLESLQNAGWLKEVADNPPITEYNEDADRNETIVPCVVRKHLHQIFTSIQQIAG